MRTRFILLVLALSIACTKLDCNCERDDVQRVGIADKTVEHWKRRGFTQLVPPIRLPSSIDGQAQIQIWIRLPNSGVIETLHFEDQNSYELRYPPGSEADRVELEAGEVVDVRGTLFLAEDREEFHVYRRQNDELRGFKWMRGDRDAQAYATKSLVRMLENKRSVPQLGKKAIQRLARLNRCANCHLYSWPERLSATEGGRRHKATDASGLYQIQVVFNRSAPVQYSRPREMNLEDPFITFRCGPSEGPNPPHEVREIDGARRVTCPDSSLALATLDVSRALAAGDKRVLRMCESRRFLFDRLDDLGKRAFAASMADCEKRQ